MPEPFPRLIARASKQTYTREAISPGSRLYGVDAARAIAIAGMVMVHFGPFEPRGTLAANLYSLSSGRASVLFAVLAGLSVSLLAGASRSSGPATVSGPAAPPARGQTRLRLLLRALPLLPLGLWLQQLDHNALVILQYYSLYFLLAAAVLGLSSERLLQIAGLVLIFGPLIYLLVATAAPEWLSQLPPTLTDNPAAIARALLLTGAYPLITWAAPVLFGMWLGRRDLRTVRLGLSLLAGGAALTAMAAAVSVVATIPALEPDSQTWSFLLSSEPHSQSPIWMAGAIGSACAVLGLMLLAAEAAPRLMWPLAATGQLALTIYVGHIIAMDLTGGLLERDDIAGASLTVAGFMAAAIAFSFAYKTLFRQGPLEALLALPWHTLSTLHGRSDTREEGRDGRL